MVHESNNIAVGKRIRDIRTAHMLTQAQFAEKIKITRGYLSQLEAGLAEPSSIVRLAICNVFAIREDWLLYGNEPMYDDRWRLLEDRAKELGEDIHIKFSTLEATKKRFDELVNDEGSMDRTQDTGLICEASSVYNINVSKLGVYSMAGAGGPKDLTEYEPIEDIWVPKEFAGPNIVPVKVRGMSMHPTLWDGAIIGVNKEDRQITSGEIFAVWIPYEGAVIKRLFMELDKVLVKSDNKEFPTFSIPYKELEHSTHGENFILGRVKWVIQKR